MLRLRPPLLVPAALFALAACEPRPAESSQPAPALSVRSARPAVRHPSTLVKLAIFSDKTGSAPSTRTPELDYESLENLVKALSNRAELDVGVGLITDQSDRSLVRLRITPPPDRPAQAPEHLPANPFDRLYSPPAPANSGEFEKAMGEWSADRDRKLAMFKNAATALLQAPTRGRSDIEGALQRADMMLGEPEARFAEEHLHRWAILVTDGLHTTSRRAVTLRSGATLVVVNASGTIGVLERLSPLRFESPARAFQFVADKELSSVEP